MRQLLSCATLVVITLAASACRESTASSPASSPRAVPTGEFRVLVPASPASLNPDLDLDEVSIVIGRNIFNHLVAINESGRLLPELAESWSTSPDGLTYTFHLRDGVRWHDGAPFTSADVRWTLEMIRKDGFAGKDALAPVHEIATPDPSTVVITLEHSWAPFASDLAGPGLAVLPRHVYEGTDWRTNPANRRPIGTGPFRFERWDNDHTLVLQANTDFFRSGPYVHRVIFEATAADAVATKLMAGVADYSVVRPAAITLSKPPEPLVSHTMPSSGRYYLAMNLRQPPLDDPRVRHALASAVDRLEIIAEALGGFGAPALGYYTPDVEWAYNSAARVPEFDLQAAARALDAAGWPLRKGERFHLSVPVANTPPVRDIAEIVRAQFAKIGVILDIERLSPADWPKRTIAEHKFDLTIVTGGQGPDPDQLRRRFLADTATGAYIGYSAPDFRDAVERGARLVDIAERAAAYHRAQEILARDVPFIPLAESVRVIIHNRRVSGLPQLEARGLVGAFDFSLVKLSALPPATPQ